MPNQVNVTLNVGQNPSNGSYVYSWSGDAPYVDPSGNVDLSSITNPITVRISLTSALNLSFVSPARDTMLMCPASELPPGGCPNTNYPNNGTEFGSFSFPGNNQSLLSFHDNNNDDVDWAYALQIHNNTTNTTFVCDPNIINR